MQPEKPSSSAAGEDEEEGSSKMEEDAPMEESAGEEAMEVVTSTEGNEGHDDGGDADQPASGGENDDAVAMEDDAVATKERGGSPASREKKGQDDGDNGKEKGNGEGEVEGGEASTAAQIELLPPNPPEGDMLLVGSKSGIYHCDYCMRDISTTVRIKCATCKDFDLCVDCFSVGVELNPHKNTHPYRVVDNTSFPVFAYDWTATEELSTLAALEQYGMGNWGKVSEVLGVKDKTERACMDHYLDLYLPVWGKCLPETTIVDGVMKPTSELITNNPSWDEIKEATVEDYPAAKYLEKAQPLQAKGTPVQREKFTITKPTGKQGKEDRQAANATGSDAIPGYMPLRGDFDVEHDNDAEHILADMEIDPSDDPAETELKLLVVEVYNRKLDERERRKKFVQEHGLIDYKSLQNKEKRKPKDERELLAKMRVFARFHSPEEHEKFVAGIMEAKRIRKRIEQLQNYRRLGITTQAQAAAYEAEKRRREQDQQMRKQREGAAYLYDSAKPSNTTKDRTNRYIKRNRDSYEGALGDDEDGSKFKASSNSGGGGPPTLNIDTAPHAEQLSAKEKELCSALRMLPKHYLVIKDALLRESFNRGLLQNEARKLVAMDMTKVDQVYDFFVRCGWVTGSTRPDVKDIKVTFEAAAGDEGGDGEEGQPKGKGKGSEKVAAMEVDAN